MKKRSLMALLTVIGLILALLIGAGNTVAQTDRTYDCLSPRAAPDEPRIAFTGTLDDAQAFFQATTKIEALGNVEIATWTQGLPIIIPTEVKVSEMLTGTTHSRDEVMGAYTRNPDGTYVKSADPVTFAPKGWQATVEKVAVNAVMAGARPEYFPIILAIASTGLELPDPSSTERWASWVAVSGSIAKEIGMNAGSGAFNGGNPANVTIGYAQVLMGVNLAGSIQGVTRSDYGSPWNRAGCVFAEDDSTLPQGWETLRQEGGYSDTENALMLVWSPGSILSTQHAPSSFRGLNSGSGGLARRLGVEGKPGFYNYFEYLMPALLADAAGPMAYLTHSGMAQSLKDAGFASKAAVYDWIWNASMVPMSRFKQYVWYDQATNGGTAIEPISGKPYKDLPDDFKTPAFGSSPKDSVMIVGFSPGDETTVELRLRDGRPPLVPIDPWR